MYKILYKDGDAKRGQLETVHGTIQTPVFMNVGTDRRGPPGRRFWTAHLR